MDEVIGVAPVNPIHFRSVPGGQSVESAQQRPNIQMG
jgi:hypothetical protein